MRISLILAGLMLTLACGGGSPPTLPAGLADGGADAGATLDSGQSDSGPSPDAGTPDAGVDGGISDAGSSDAGNTCTWDGGLAVPSVEVTPPGGTYTGSIDVALTVSDGATVAYTTDGSDPLTSGSAVDAQSLVVVHLTAPGQVTLAFAVLCDTGGGGTTQKVSYTLQAANPASISGAVFTHPLLQTANGQVEVLLYDQDPTANPGAMAIGATDISPSSPSGTDFLFQNQPAGRYWIAAAWWPGTVSGNPQAFALALRNPVDLNPSVPSLVAAGGIDVYLGECDPAGTGVDGVVTVGTSLQADMIGVAAYAQALTFVNLQMPTPQPDVTYAPGAGEQRPFALCNLPPGKVNVLAGATASGSTNPDALVAYAMNPVATSPVSHLMLDLGAPMPNLGSISGNISLSGPLPGGAVTTVVTATPWSMDTPFLGSDTVLTGMSTSYSYSIVGLAPGTYYLTAVAKDDAGTAAVAVANSAFTVTSSALDATINVHANVGRVHGNIDVKNADSAPTEVLVGTPTTPGAMPNFVGVANVQLGPADTSGTSHGTYDIFGIADGSYDAIALFEISGDTTFQESFQNGHYLPQLSMLPSVNITQGSNVEVDFSGRVP